MAVNMAIPIAFLPRIEAAVTLAVFVALAGVQMLMFRRMGFVRLLGAGHFPWFALLAWIATRLPMAAAGSAYRAWLMTLLTLNGASLAIDAVDVIRYWRGERTPTYRME